MLATLFGGKLLNLLVVEWYIGTVAWSIGTQNHTYKGDKIMTRKETLERVADELRCNVDNHFDVALLSIVETLAEMCDKENNISWSCGNIGIDVMSDRIVLVDIEAGRAILTLEVNYND
jgi:hypothetical protein